MCHKPYLTLFRYGGEKMISVHIEALDLIRSNLQLFLTISHSFGEIRIFVEEVRRIIDGISG